ncbi:MAG TPA: glycoside hydrolase family 44 protein [Chloroflexota bacterium]|nr:glycoside hydrolase family 44 protein [Chloroflexota bacterium]
MPRLAWVAALAGMLLVLGAAVGTAVVHSRGVSLTSVAAAAWRRVVPRQQQPATWRESAPPNGVLLKVDTSGVLRPISPLIYGLGAASTDELAGTGATLNRWGGNPNSRYNWANGNAWNAARDWEFRNYGSDGSSIGAPSQAADRFVATNQARGVTSLITVPALGWVASTGNRELASVGVPADGGPPVGDGSTGAILGYDPSFNRHATSVASFPRKAAPFADPPDQKAGVVFQDEWVSHLVNRFGPADTGGVRFYAIDNEPDLWSTTHTDVHPVQPDYTEELTSFLDYAEAVKDVDPAAQILGPSLSGWTAMFYSARDRGTDAYRTHADRVAHGNMPFLPWWLEQVRQHDQQVGRRTLDVLDVHDYPQANGVWGGATDEQTNRVRVRSTRSLWDPTYIDESWIADSVQLIPRLRGWIDQYYPGTKLAIGEWNWGADTTLNGAVAIADVLGIFGREGVDMAAYWTSPHPGSPGANAFRMYTNYDGQGHGFGDLALAATSSAPDDVAVFASRDSVTGDTLVMVINQRPDVPLTTTVQLSGMGATVAELYRLDATAPHVQDQGLFETSPGELHLVLPPESISLVRIQAP